MWAVKIEVPSQTQFLGRMAIKHQISMIGYPLSYYREKESLALNLCGMIFGEEKNKDLFIKDLRTQNELVNIQRQNDFSILTLHQPLASEILWNPKILRPNPTIINSHEKLHIWELVSFERDVLESVVTYSREKLGGRLIKFCKREAVHMSVLNMLPKLSSQQKRAMEIAIQNGYYSYPKKSKMQDLAKIMGISYSTYQQHLKVAESKLLPALYARL